MRQERRKLFALLSVVMMLLSGCTAKTVVNRVRPNSENGRAQMNGVFYALPRTVIQVDVPVTKKVATPGKFVRFAECFFPDEKEDIISDKKTTFSIGDPKFASRGEPDPAQVFIIKVPGSYFEDKTLLLDLTSEGVLAKGEASSTHHGLEIATNAIKTFVPILGSLATGIGKSTLSRARELGDDLLTPKQEECLCEVINDRDCKDQATGWKKVPDLAKLDVAGFSADLDEAISAYKGYLVLQSDRDKLVSGLTGSSLPKDTFELMLKELDARIKSIKDLFMGSVGEKTWTGRFEFAPEKGNMGKKLFDYIEDQGICSVDYTGINVMDPKFRNTVNCTDSQKKSVLLTVTMGRPGQATPQFSEQVTAANLRQDGDRGFYYRIPAMSSARVTVEPYSSLDTRFRSRSIQTPASVVDKGHDNILVAQLGETVSLPSSSNGRTTKYSLVLDPTSGAMKNFVLGSEALIQSSAVTDIGAAAGSLVDARNKRREAEAASSDELNQLERKRKILEEMLKIKEAEEKLGKPNQ